MPGEKRGYSPEEIKNMISGVGESGPTKETESPFEDEGPGSPEDAAKLAKVIEEKGIGNDLAEMGIRDAVADLSERFKTYKDRSTAMKSKNLKVEAGFLDDSEKSLKDILALTAEIRKNPAEPGALDRVKRLIGMANEIAAVRDEVKGSKKMLEIMEQGRKEQEEEDFKKEIAQPSVIVSESAARPSRTRRVEMPQADEEGAGIFERQPDGSLKRVEPKKPGFFSRILKRK